MAQAFSAGSSFFGSIFGGYLLGTLLDMLFGTADTIAVVGTILGFLSGNLLVFKIFMATPPKKE